MSFDLKIDPKRRAAGRFIGKVRKALLSAALDERELSGISQQSVADILGVNRSVVNRMIRGNTNLTLRSVAELAWALGWEPEFTLHRKSPEAGSNRFLIVASPQQTLWTGHAGATTQTLRVDAASQSLSSTTSSESKISSVVRVAESA